jgi:hypothetical protein
MTFHTLVGISSRPERSEEVVSDESSEKNGRAPSPSGLFPPIPERFLAFARNDTLGSRACWFCEAPSRFCRVLIRKYSLEISVNILRIKRYLRVTMRKHSVSDRRKYRDLSGIRWVPKGDSNLRRRVRKFQVLTYATHRTLNAQPPTHNAQLNRPRREGGSGCSSARRRLRACAGTP